jgi:hypothetical protein
VTDQLLTAATVRQAFLEPGMDLVALTGWQDLLIENRQTPQLDSIVEVLEAVRPQLPPGEGAELTALLLRLSHLQGEEGRIQHLIAGAADGITRRLRGLELAGTGSPFTSQAVARRLREPLAAIVDAENRTARELVEAGRIVGEVLGALPARQIFTAEVEHQLGAVKYAALRSLGDHEDVATCT